jgi:hypothetical protein
MAKLQALASLPAERREKCCRRQILHKLAKLWLLEGAADEGSHEVLSSGCGSVCLASWRPAPAARAVWSRTPKNC